MISFILLAVGILLLVLLIIGIVDNIDTIGKVIEDSLEGLF